MNKKWLAGAAVLGALLSGAVAQGLPVYESTGTIEFSVDGKPSTYYTTSNTVPNEPQRMVHTASWKVFPPMMLGGINMAPPGVFVSLVAQPGVEPDSAAPQLKITFSVDETSHTLLESAPFEVVYTVKEGELAGVYQHASGSLQIESVTPGGNDVLQIKGRATGTLAVKGKGKKKAGEPLNYQAEFTVEAHPQ